MEMRICWQIELLVILLFSPTSSSFATQSKSNCPYIIASVVEDYSSKDDSKPNKLADSQEARKNAFTESLGRYLVGANTVFDLPDGTFREGKYADPTEFLLNRAQEYLNHKDSTAILEAGGIYTEMVLLGYPLNKLSMEQRQAIKEYARFKRDNPTQSLPSVILDKELERVTQDPLEFEKWFNKLQDTIESTGEIPDKYKPLVAGWTSSNDGIHNTIILLRSPKHDFYAFIEFNNSRGNIKSLTGRGEAMLPGVFTLADHDRKLEVVSEEEKRSKCLSCHDSGRLDVGSTKLSFKNANEARNFQFVR